VLAALATLAPEAAAGISIDAPDFAAQVLKVAGEARKTHIGFEGGKAGAETGARKSVEEKFDKSKERANFIEAMRRDGKTPQEMATELQKYDASGARYMAPKSQAANRLPAWEVEQKAIAQRDADNAASIIHRSSILRPTLALSKLQQHRAMMVARGLNPVGVDALINEINGKFTAQ
jgi:hypothetical protein